MSAFSRFSLWLSRDDHAFNLMLFVLVPPLATVIAIGFFS